MKLTIITSNPGKAKEIKEWIVLSKNITIEHKDIDVPEIRDSSIEKVATHKALEVFKIFKEPFIVEDTGIFFEEYKDFPGAFTKIMFHSLGYEGLLKLTEKDNKAYFKTVIAYMDSSLKKPKLFTGISKGHITNTIDNKALKGLPYDNIFIKEGFSKTNSELSFEELKKGHNRAKALKLFSEFLKKHAREF